MIVNFMQERKRRLSFLCERFLFRLGEPSTVLFEKSESFELCFISETVAIRLRDLRNVKANKLQSIVSLLREIVDGVTS